MIETKPSALNRRNMYICRYTVDIYSGCFLLADFEFADFPAHKNVFVTPRSILEEPLRWQKM